MLFHMKAKVKDQELIGSDESVELIDGNERQRESEDDKDEESGDTTDTDDNDSMVKTIQ